MVPIDDRLVCEKLTIFPYAELSLSSVNDWLSYDIVTFKIELGVEEKFMCKNVTKQTQHVHCDSSNTAALRGGHILDLDLTVNMLGLCDPSNLLLEYSFYQLRSDALFSNYFEDLLQMITRMREIRKKRISLINFGILLSKPHFLLRKFPYFRRRSSI